MRPLSDVGEPAVGLYLHGAHLVRSRRIRHFMPTTGVPAPQDPHKTADRRHPGGAARTRRAKSTSTSRTTSSCGAFGISRPWSGSSASRPAPAVPAACRSCSGRSNSPSSLSCSRSGPRSVQLTCLPDATARPLRAARAARPPQPRSPSRITRRARRRAAAVHRPPRPSAPDRRAGACPCRIAGVVDLGGDPIVLARRTRGIPRMAMPAPSSPRPAATPTLGRGLPRDRARGDRCARHTPASGRCRDRGGRAGDIRRIRHQGLAQRGVGPVLDAADARRSSSRAPASAGCRSSRTPRATG